MAFLGNLVWFFMFKGKESVLRKFFFFLFYHSALFLRVKEKLLLLKMTKTVYLGRRRNVTLWVLEQK